MDGPIWNGRRFGVDGLFKAGIYGNDVDVSSLADDGLNDLPLGRGSNSTSSAAFLAEWGLTASYKVSNCLSLRGGYQGIVLDGVALAADQVPNSGDLVPIGLNVPVSVSRSTLVFHGLTAGIELAY